MKRKSFGISKNLSQGMSDTINAVKNNVGGLRYEVIPLSRIEIDPENPRTLAVTVEDIVDGLKGRDPQYGIKKDEIEKLGRLGETIKKSGLINAVVVYKKDGKYRLAAGERRFLASLLAEKEDIQARVFDEAPTEDQLRMLQWIENTEREDLSLKDRLGNIRAIISGYETEHHENTVTATILKDILSVSLPHASNYISLLNAAPDVREKINSGGINSIEKGAFLSRIKDRSIRESLMKACEDGSSLRQLQSTFSALEAKKRENKLNEKNVKNGLGLRKAGKPLTRINMGVTRNPAVIKMVVECVVDHPKLKKYAAIFEQVHWEDFDQANSAFRKMINFLEIENAKR